MDYKEKYNKLVEAIKVLQETNPTDEGIQNWVNDNVPELHESESWDEKIRKELIKVFSNREKYLIDQSFGDITVSEVLTWLEKQKPEVEHLRILCAIVSSYKMSSLLSKLIILQHHRP